MIFPKKVLSHRNTIVKKVELKEVNVLLLRKFCCFINLILSGDVGLNPRPGSYVKNNAAKCSVMQ